MKNLLFISIIFFPLIISCNKKEHSYEIKFTSSPVNIDGKIDSIWFQSNLDSINNLAIGGYNRKNNKDLNGYFRMLWDEKNLYILFDVVDDKRVGYEHFVKEINGDVTFELDGIQLYLDMDNDRKNEKFTGKNYRYNLAYSFKELLGENIQTDGVSFKQNDTPGGYLIELMFPWKTLRFTPEKNEKFDCEIHLVDCDDDRFLKEGFFDGSKLIMAWNEKTTQLEARNAKIYGQMKLVE